MLTDTQCNEILVELIETCRDGQEGFLLAADGVRESEVRQEFLDSSYQRYEFVKELRTLLREVDGKQPEQGPREGIGVQHGWVNIRSAVANRNEKQVLEECTFGQDAAINTYREALVMKLPRAILEVLREQYIQIREGRNWLLEQKLRISLAGIPKAISG